MLKLDVDRRRMSLLTVVVVIAMLGAMALGAALVLGGPWEPLPDGFGTGELLGWTLLALVSGGLTFGAKGRRPPLFASGLVGSAALLGAGPAACALIGAAGAIGGLRRGGGMAGPRIAVAGVLGWSLPALLAVAASVGGPPLGNDHPLPLASVIALWVLVAVGMPVAESIASMVALDPADHVGPMHMLAHRLEPYSVLAALAVLAAMSYSAIGAAAGLVVLLPAVSARVGFALHEEGRRAVSQTLAAMTVLPEWVGIVDVGHTARVRSIAERVALDLDLESRVRRDVVRAAELHELGHLDTGADRDDRGRVARSGAAVLEQAGMRERVTRMVDATDPDRPVEARDGDVELGAAIVSTACELDRLERQLDVTDASARVRTALGKAHRSAGAFL